MYKLVSRLNEYGADICTCMITLDPVINAIFTASQDSLLIFVRLLTS